MQDLPSLSDVVEASHRIGSYITRTPLHRYETLDKLIGAEVYVKHENHQRLGSFKMRGAINLVAQLTAMEKDRGIVVASTGNFGQGIAYAGRLFGVRTSVVMPADANRDKVEAIKLLGGQPIFYGVDFDDAREHAEFLSEEEGFRYVHSANEPMLIAGVGTYSLEIIEDLPDADVIIVPIGGGSGACGACIVAKGMDPRKRIIGVGAYNAPAAYMSWRERRLVESKMETVAEGLGTRVGFELTQSILQDQLDDFVLVSDDELSQAVVLHLVNTHNITEHAGAASLAAAVKIRDRLSDSKVVIVASGGNITIDQLSLVLS